MGIKAGITSACQEFQMRANVLVLTLFVLFLQNVRSAEDPQLTHKQLAEQILADPDLQLVLDKARVLLKTGLTAGSGYGEVWIRDLNTFIELSLQVNPPKQIRTALLTFFQFQLPNGDVPDGFIPKERGSVSYNYRRSDLAPGLIAHKNTVETDQETSLVQAVRRYVTTTKDRALLREEVAGKTVLDRLELALEYLLNERFDSKHGLIWGATTADWGDVQPEHEWGVEFDASSHRAIDIYDNAMFVIAIGDFLQLLDQASPKITRWTKIRDETKQNIRKYLWDTSRQKFIPHIYLGDSPFPKKFDESAIYYHGGTAVAIEAGILSHDEIARALQDMRANVRAAGASSIGLTIYPPYPKGFFKNTAMSPYSYQNGGDWCWFGARMIQQLIRNGFAAEAYAEIKPMVSRVKKYGDFYEWWSLANEPRGSKQYRGSAGALGQAILLLNGWAQENIGPAETRSTPILFKVPAGGITLTNSDPSGSTLKSFLLPTESMRGAYVYVAANIKAQSVSAKSQPWNGIKLMLKIETPGRTDWPQPNLPVGTFDSRRFSNRVFIPADATAATLTLGLEKVSGVASFDQVEISLDRYARPAPAAPADQAIFRAHDLPRLRGAMVSPRMTEADLATLANEWHANLIRWQIIRSNHEAQSQTNYDQWLDGMLAKTDQVLEWSKKRRVKVVLDLHSPPGGQLSQGGYVAAMGEIFNRPEAQEHFIEVWRKMARRYKGNSVIWGFDLVNEPVDDQTAPGCQDWQGLALSAGRAIREIDPERILIVEPPRWGGPSGFEEFNPIPLPRVVYSFHMYEPHRFTHQRVFDKNQAPVAYPGEIEGQNWNREKLIKAMQPAIDFARKYRMHLYVGEFSAIRWAPGAEKYLADLTSIFEEQGWDWSYHAYREWSGWSLEHSADEQNDQPAEEKTARFNVIERWLKQSSEGE